jgi:DNA-binding NarL/FixJ family response regulator
MQQLRVAVHAPDQLSISGLVHCLDHAPELVPVSWTADGASADVGLMAVDRTVDMTAFTRLRSGKRTPVMPIVLIADRLTDVEVRTVARYGVERILPRTGLDRGELVASIVMAATGQRQELVPAIPAQPSPSFDSPVAKSRHASLLQPRETDVLQLLADGFDTPEIAGKLCYSERTVKNIISKVMHRLDLRSRTHAVAYAVRVGAI